MMGENLPPTFNPHFVKQTPYAFSEEGKETTCAIPKLNSIQARPQQQQQHAPQPQQRQLQSSSYQYYSYHTPSYRQDQRPRLRPWEKDDLLSDWLYHLQDVSEHLNWNINRQKMEFRSTLAEVDPSILRKLDSRLDRQTCTLEQMVELAAKHVGQDIGSIASMTDFSICKRKNGQSAHAYMNHLEKLAARAFPGCSRREYNTRLVNQFTMGIGDPKLQDILTGLNSEAIIDEAIELVHRAMAVKSHITSKEQPATLTPYNNHINQIHTYHQSETELESDILIDLNSDMDEDTAARYVKVLSQAEQRKRENISSKDSYQGNRQDKAFRFNKRPPFCQWCKTRHRAPDCPQLASLRDEGDPVTEAQSSLKCQKVHNQSGVHNDRILLKTVLQAILDTPQAQGN